MVLRQPASTHLLAQRIAREYRNEGATAPVSDFLAWRQTAGRGRAGRDWSSPAGGGVYATLIRPLPVDRFQTLPLLVATALCDALNVHLDGNCRLKWPNDLLIGGRKLGGVLIDVSSGANGLSGTAVISFGVNHTQDPGAPRATSLELEAPGRIALADLAAELVEAVDASLGGVAGADEIVDRYRRVSVHSPGETMRCRVGGDEIEGVFEGFDANGFLRLRVAGEERLLTAGEVGGHG